jgi:hypothetical protein
MVNWTKEDDDRTSEMAAKDAFAMRIAARSRGKHLAFGYAPASGDARCSQSAISGGFCSKQGGQTTTTGVETD